MKLYLEDFPEYLKVEKNKLNLLAIKELLANMEKKDLVIRQKQQLIFDEKVFNKMWNLYYNGLEHYDVNYNRKTDIKSYFKYMLENDLENIPTNFFALFCPGYTDDGYKDRLGHTTIWKLKELKDILEFYKKYDLDSTLICCYSDVFLENVDTDKNSNWKAEMEYNRSLFHKEAQKYFPKEWAINTSDLPIFQSEDDVAGYINEDMVNQVRGKTYHAFTVANQKFYTKLGFSEAEMKYRNDKLITMYRILSDYLNQTKNMVFLPMENMYERENIFSENGTCTMYLNLKR